MKKLFYLSGLFLSACSLFVIPKENQCEDGSPELSCDGNVLVFCDQENNFQIREDCGAEQTCNPNASPPRCELNASTRCGDGTVQAPEECDDGNTDNGDACEGNCQEPDCGDGVLNTTNSEACDDANQNDDDACGNDCQINIPPGCGNGVVDAGEECDTALAAPCDADCSSPRCGNGITSVDQNNQAEACDDGNTNDGDGCSSLCAFEVALPPFCGNGNLDAGETCDEGAANNNGETCNANCSLPACGDSFLNPQEECDDGNPTNGDGCSSVCLFENIFIGLCGDGVVAQNEECDDGNTLNADGCQATCQLPRCGDGVFDAGEVCFAPPGTLVAGGNGASPQILGDFNNDGFVDVAVAHFDTDNVSVFFGNGDGSFGAPLLLATGDTPIDGASGDFDEDGFVDLVVSNHNADTLSVFFNNGNETFQSAVIISGNGINNPQSIEAADLDEDGHLDLAVANRFGNNILIFLGVGDGTFGAPLPSPSVGTEPRNLQAADLNNDGILDLVTAANGSSTVSVLEGNGDGTFAVAFQDVPGGAVFNSQEPKVADFNNDGLLDFTTGRNVDSDVFVYINTGNFGFQRSGPFDLPGSLPEPEVGDFDEDGDVDIIAPSAQGVALLLTNNGTGAFSQSFFSLGQINGGVIAQDINRDGHLDLLLPQNLDPGQIVVAFGFGDGSFTPQRDLPATPAGSQSMNITSGDLNNDGLPDLVVGAFFGARYAVYLNNGGGFSAPTLLTTGGEPRGAALADLDLDGDLDLAGFSTGENTAVLHFNNGSGTFGAPVVTNLGAGGLPKSVSVADMNHDGKPDLMYGRDFLVGVLRGNGDGTFQTVVNVPSGGRPSFMAVVDINKDGDPDLVNTSFLDFNIQVLRGNGDLTFQAETALPTSFRPNRASVVDFNGDGELDIAAGQQDQSFFHFFSGNGDGTFGARQDIQTDFVFTGDSSAADINQDGIFDLVMGNGAQASVGVLLGNGDGTFLDAVFLPVGGQSPTITVEDFNQDGRLDIASTNINNTTSLVFGFFR